MRRLGGLIFAVFLFLGVAGAARAGLIITPGGDGSGTITGVGSCGTGSCSMGTMTMGTGVPFTWTFDDGAGTDPTFTASGYNLNFTSLGGQMEVLGGVSTNGAQIRNGSSGNVIHASALAATIAGGGTTGTAGCTIGAAGCINEITAATALYATIGGGCDNLLAGGPASTIGGGCHHTNTQTNGHCTIGGGSTNSCTGADGYAFIGSGMSNSIAGNFSAIVGGFENAIAAGGDFSFVGGGNENTIAAGVDFAVNAGGLENQVTANFASVPGGRLAVANHYGGVTHASGFFASPGDAQTTVAVVRRLTSDATQSELFGDGASTRSLLIPDDSTWTYSALITARNTITNGQSAGFRCEGVIARDAGVTANVGTPTVTPLGASAGAATWAVVCDGNDAADTLRVRVTGEATKLITWVARVTLVEVTG